MTEAQAIAVLAARAERAEAEVASALARNAAELHERDETIAVRDREIERLRPLTLLTPAMLDAIIAARSMPFGAH